jgi:hypothetical protein
LTTRTIRGIISAWLGDRGILVTAHNGAARQLAESRQALQLLGARAAILRYMREYGALPKSLEVLQLGEVVTDPLSGKPFDYRKTGGQRTYG